MRKRFAIMGTVVRVGQLDVMEAVQTSIYAQQGICRSVSVTASSNKTPSTPRQSMRLDMALPDGATPIGSLQSSAGRRAAGHA